MVVPPLLMISKYSDFVPEVRKETLLGMGWECSAFPPLIQLKEQGDTQADAAAKNSQFPFIFQSGSHSWMQIQHQTLSILTEEGGAGQLLGYLGYLLGSGKNGFSQDKVWENLVSCCSLVSNSNPCWHLGKIKIPPSLGSP